MNESEKELEVFKSLQKDVEDSLNNLHICFENEVKEYVKTNYPGAGTISFSINNHEWNDGDITRFYVRFYAGTVYNTDEDLIDEDVDISHISDKYPDVLWEHAYGDCDNLTITID